MDPRDLDILVVKVMTPGYFWVFFWGGGFMNGIYHEVYNKPYQNLYRHILLQVSTLHARYGLPFVYLPSRHMIRALLCDNAMGPTRLCGVINR